MKGGITHFRDFTLVKTGLLNNWSLFSGQFLARQVLFSLDTVFLFPWEGHVQPESVRLWANRPVCQDDFFLVCVDSSAARQVTCTRLHTQANNSDSPMPHNMKVSHQVPGFQAPLQSNCPLCLGRPKSLTNHILCLQEQRQQMLRPPYTLPLGPTHNAQGV